MDTKLNSTDRPIALYYIFFSDVLSFTNEGNSNCKVSVNGDWNLIRTSIGSISFKETTDSGDSGTIFKSNLSATVPGIDDDSPETTQALSGRPALIRVDYRSGRQKIIGSSSAKARMYIDAESSTLTKRTVRCSFTNSVPNRWLS
jgi:hypothetical protein